MTLCCIVNLNTEKTVYGLVTYVVSGVSVANFEVSFADSTIGEIWTLLQAWHHFNSDFQAFWNLAKYLVFFAAGALGDSIRFGIFVVYQFHPGT